MPTEHRGGRDVKRQITGDTALIRVGRLRPGPLVACWLLLGIYLLPSAAGELPSPGGAARERAPSSPHVSVVEWGPAHVRLVYEVDAAAAVAAATGAEGATVESVHFGAIGGEPGAAAILGSLVEGVLVGMPQEGGAHLEILEAREVARFPAVAGSHLRDGVQPSNPASLGEVGYLRDQRVVGVRFGPGLEPDGTIVVYDHIVAQVHMEGVSAAARVGSKRSGERFAEAMYAAAVVNYEQARGWRGKAWAAAKPVQEQVSQDQRLRIIVRGTGLFRITGEDLVEAGIHLQAVQPARLRVLYGGGRTLGRSGRVSPGIRPVQIPIIVEDGGDGAFDASDYVLFYGEPAERWQYDAGSRSYSFLQNPYTNDNVYYLAVTGEQDGLRAGSRSGALTDPEALHPDRYRERIHLEEDRHIFLELEGLSSGYDWYWESFQGNAQDYSFAISDAVDDPVDVRARIWGWSVGTHRFDLRWNRRTIGRRTFSGAGSATVAARGMDGPTEGMNQLGILHRGGESTRLDWVELEYSRRLAARKGELSFDWADAARTGAGTTRRGVAAFELTGFAGERPRVFDVAHGLAEIVDLTHDTVAGTLEFQDKYNGSSRPPLYVAAASSSWHRPARISRDEPSHLRAEGNGAEYIIITHSDFGGAAERLAAWRSRDDRFGEPMATAVVDVEDVYDEFSGGMVDPMAIRSFVHHAVLRWEPAPFFILLMGDGTYDYKNNSGASHPNWMPAFQDGVSMYDEWYVRIAGEDALPDLAVGRLPVQTAAEASGVVDKLIAYDREPERGPWRARSLLIADDELNPGAPSRSESTFLIDAEVMTHRYIPKDLDLVKLYLAQYPLEGRIKPRARDAFVRRFNEGALFVTYLGHGNPEALAHEQMFVLSRDIADIDNGHRWPFMYTAASQVGVFDDPLRQSIPEALLNLPDRGVIGFISATRVGFHATNVVLARAFYKRMFQSGESHVPVGLALTVAKQVAAVSESDPKGRTNVQRYSLLGDPATRLARPVHQVELLLPDTLRALEEVHLSGRVLDAAGRHLDDYHGTARVQVFDSSSSSRLGSMPYIKPGAPIYRSLARVHDGRFEARFRVPRDITYRSWGGRASAYVWQDGPRRGPGDESAFGSVSGLRFEGTAELAELDETGPGIQFGFAGRRDFRTGDSVLAPPVLEAVITDQSGINITGETGHGIALSVDGVVSQVTESFTNLDGDYRSGVLTRALGPLDAGVHTIGLKVWDNHNNSSRSEVEIRVREESSEALGEVLFYPNPMDGDTGFFTYTLKAPAEEVRIQVFTLAGRLIDEIAGSGGTGHHQVAWAPHPVDLARGTYLYRIEAALEGGGSTSSTSVICKLQDAGKGER